MKITTILPIFNEEKTVANVLSVLLKAEQLDEIIVIDDASTDNSLNIIKSFKSGKLKIIRLEENLGKSGAVKIAVKKTRSDILFFCDGDLHNFTNQHINQLLEPLKAGKFLMAVGIRDRGILHNAFVKKFGPLITGERALPYELFGKIINSPLMDNYAMEVLLNDYCLRNNVFIKKMILRGVKQTNKPYKYKNKLKGVYFLIQEAIGLATVYVKLKIFYAKYNAKS